MNWLQLLAEEAGGQEAAPSNGWVTYVLLGVIVLAFIAFMLFSGRKNKQRQKEYVEQIAAIGPGNKVKTAGGICGIVVEVCDDNTVIIETGSEQSGKSYIKMDKELIAQTDAKGPTQLAREEAEAAKKVSSEQKSKRKGESNPASTEPQDTPTDEENK